nr:unnamed protein product [Callosobruchus analis]
MFTYFPAFFQRNLVFTGFSKRMSTSDSTANSSATSNSPSENVQTKDTTELTPQRPEVKKELDDCINNEPRASICSGSSFDSRVIDRMKSQDITPRRGIKNGVIKNASEIWKKHRTSLSIEANAIGQHAFQKLKKSSPRKARRNGIINNVISNYFQPIPKTANETSVFEEIEVSILSPKTISNGNVSKSLTEPSSQTSLHTLVVSETSENVTPKKSRKSKLDNENLSDVRSSQAVSQKSEVSTGKRTRSASESLLEIVIDYKLSKKATNPTYRRTQSIGRLNGFLTPGVTSQLDVSDIRSSQAVSKKREVSTAKRTRSASESIHELLIELSKKPKTSTLRRIHRIETSHGTLITLAPLQPNEETDVKKPKLPPPIRKISNGVVNGVLVDIKDLQESIPTKTRSIEKVNGILNDSAMSQVSPQRLAQNVSKVQKARGRTPKRPRSSIGNVPLPDMNLAQPTSHETAQEPKESIEILTESLQISAQESLVEVQCHILYFYHKHIRDAIIVQKARGRTPKRPRSSIGNVPLPDMNLSQPSSHETSQVSQEANRLTLRKTKSSEKLNGTLTYMWSPQPTLLFEHQVPEYKEPKESREILTDSLAISAQESLVEKPKNSTLRRTQSIGTLNGSLTPGVTSKLNTSDIKSSQAVSKKLEVSTAKRTRSTSESLHEPLMDHKLSKKSKTSTLRRIHSIGKRNGTIITDFPLQPNVETAVKKPKLSTAIRKRNNGVKNDALIDIKVKKAIGRTPKKLKSSIDNVSLSDMKLPQPTSQETAQVSKEANGLTLKKTKSSEKLNGTLTDMWLPQPTLLFEHQIPVYEGQEEITPRKTRSIEKANGVLTDTAVSQITPQRLTQNVSKVQKVRGRTPKRPRSSIGNVHLSDMKLSSPTSQETAQEANKLPLKKTKSSEKLNGTLTDAWSPQPTLLFEHQVAVYEQPKVSIEILTESLPISDEESLTEGQQESTPTKARSIEMANGVLTDSSMSQITPQRLSQNVSKVQIARGRTPKRPKSSIDNVSLSDMKLSRPTSLETTEISQVANGLTLKKTNSSENLNGILTDLWSPQPTLLLEDQAPEYKEPRAGPPIITPFKGFVRRRSDRNAVQVTAKETVPVVEEPKIMNDPCQQPWRQPAVKLGMYMFTSDTKIV